MAAFEHSLNVMKGERVQNAYNRKFNSEKRCYVSYGAISEVISGSGRKISVRSYDARSNEACAYDARLGVRN